MVPPPSSAAAPTPARERARSSATERASQLFTDHHREVLRFLRRRDPDLADDALSETFAVAVRRVDDIPAGKELPWLYVVADHVLRNLQRSRRRAARIPEALHPFTRHATETPGVAYIGEALSELPDRERILLTLTAFEGLSAAEAADRVGVPYGSARNAISSGRKRLALVLAAAAALVLVAGVGVAALADRTRSREPLQTLASSLSQARIVHDVAVVSHERSERGPNRAADGGARYERWSDQTSERTRVRLPGGDEVVAIGDQTLRAAASEVAGPAAPARRREVREDLAALDAASPAAIAALLASPAAQRTATDGPQIAGHDTTTVRGEIADASGTRHLVWVSIADDSPTVLRVRVGPVPGSRAARDETATVDFVAWTSVPRAAPRAAVRPTPTASTPAEITAASPSRPRPPAAKERTAPDHRSPRRTQIEPSNDRQQALTPAQSQASAPILHVRQNVVACVNDTEQCTNYGDREVWLELAGQRRSRLRTRRPSGELRNEEWTAPGERRYFTLQPGRGRVRGRLERLVDRAPDGEAPVPMGWRGAWLSSLAPIISALHSSPAAVAALPAGPELDGRATRLQTATVAAPDWDNPSRPFTADIAVDPSTGTPRQVRFHREWSETYRESVTVQIATWEQVPAGDHAALLTRRFPKGTRVSRS